MTLYFSPLYKFCKRWQPLQSKWRNWSSQNLSVQLFESCKYEFYNFCSFTRMVILKRAYKITNKHPKISLQVNENLCIYIYAQFTCQWGSCCRISPQTCPILPLISIAISLLDGRFFSGHSPPHHCCSNRCTTCVVSINEQRHSSSGFVFSVVYTGWSEK